MTPRVSQLIRETSENVCQRNEVVLEEFNTDKDHAHLLISYPPKVSLSTFVGSLKANTSRAVRSQGWPKVTQALWGKHFWSLSYFVSSVGGAPLEQVKKYVENQGKPPRESGNPNWVKK